MLTCALEFVCIDDGGGSVGETLCGLKRTFRKSGPSDSGGMRGLSSRMINKLKMISNVSNLLHIWSAVCI